LDGTGVDVPEFSVLVDLSGRDHVRVSGLRVLHSAYYDIVAETSCHVTVDHDSTYDTYSSGISCWSCDHVLVTDNEVVGACTGPWQEHISISGTDTFEVRDNHIHGVMPGTEGQEGICIKDGSQHGTVHGNRVHGLNHVGIYVDAEAVHLLDVAVCQNLVFDVEALGFSLAGVRGGPPPRRALPRATTMGTRAPRMAIGTALPPTISARTNGARGSDRRGTARRKRSRVRFQGDPQKTPAHGRCTAEESKP
jgi:hypothetical protein